mmetsp:Transcript_47482/g.76516  ORF Transcript_47482/g.76516 Transcript_47482/m.76516 type:complete len:85 (+) Transcript_47482:337-591(+)
MLPDLHATQSPCIPLSDCRHCQVNTHRPRAHDGQDNLFVYLLNWILISLALPAIPVMKTTDEVLVCQCLGTVIDGVHLCVCDCV